MISASRMGKLRLGGTRSGWRRSSKRREQPPFGAAAKAGAARSWVKLPIPPNWPIFLSYLRPGIWGLRSIGTGHRFKVFTLVNTSK